MPLKTLTAKEVIEKFFSFLIARHDCPHKLLTDQRKQFVAKIFKELCAKFNIKKIETTAYHQMSNDKIKNFTSFSLIRFRPF